MTNESMNKRTGFSYAFGVQRLILRSVSSMSILLLTIALFSVSSFGQIAVKGETVWTMEGQPITNGVVLVKNGKVEAVGPQSSIKIPAEYKVLSAKVVTPGLIDAHSMVGLNGYLNQPHDQMAVEPGSALQPELMALDAYNPEERLVEWIRGFGVTTIHAGHQPSTLMSGQTLIAKTTGNSADVSSIVRSAMIGITLGSGGNAGAGRSPGTRAKQISMLRAEFIKAQEALKKPEGSKDPRSIAMSKIIKGEIPLLVTAHKAQDITSALRLAKEFGLKMIFDGASEAMLVIDELKASGFPVIVHPTMARAGGDAASLSMETASKLKAAGITVAIQSGYEGYVPKTRVVLFEAALAAANGLSKSDALAAITIDAARILGLSDRIGSLAVGKDADIAMFDGDPFEYTTHCTGTLIDGKLVSEVIR